MSKALLEQARDALRKCHLASSIRPEPGEVEYALAAIEAELVRPEPVAVLTEDRKPNIVWTENGDPNCMYNNWLGETPFGRILITWKGWKEYHDACVDEFPGGFFYAGTPADVKDACDAEFARRLAAAVPPGHVVVPASVKTLMEDFDNPCFGSKIHNDIPREIGLAVLAARQGATP